MDGVVSRRKNYFDAEDIVARYEWLSTIDDSCLYAALIEALATHDIAVQGVASKHPRAKGEIHSGNMTIDQIKSGGIHGRAACQRAAKATQKYTHALDYVSK